MKPGLRFEGKWVLKEKGLADGTWLVFETEDKYSKKYRAPRLLYEVNFKDSLMNGVYKAYGVKVNSTEVYISLFRTYRNGLLDGSYFLFYDDGVPQEIGYYIEGKEEGVWLKYNKDGELLSERNFDRGKLINTKIYLYPGSHFIEKER
jgi:antitoxin component YwqK of YwqJK toxin-antitoxin module